MSRDVAIAGLGRTAYTVRSGRTPLALAAEAVRAAIADAGLTAADVDGIATFGLLDTALTLQVANAVGIDDLPWSVDLFGGGNAVVTMVSLAADAIRAGSAHTVVVYRAFNGRSGQRLGDAAATVALAVPEAQFDMPQGYVVPPQYLAMWARRHQHEYGSTCEDLGRIAITQRSHATANPGAIARDPLTMDGYLAGRWINEPLRVFDCAFEVDGGVAMVITSAERARDLAAPSVRLVASADSQGNGGSWNQWPDPTSMFSARVAPRLLARAADVLADFREVDVACIYDCFTYTVMAVMEDFGFAGKGEIGAYFADGKATYGGEVVVNPHGGLLSEGYLHGLNSHYEAVLQLRGQAGDRQVPGARTALVTAGAGPFGGAAIYLADR
ncbi:MAG TPA: lipid-transfer protein [Pseudonocardia sp.]|jgi:acetyl-CoA acetyltransferase